VNDHGGKQAEAEFWERHRKGGEHGHVQSDARHGHVTASNEPVGHVTARDGKAGSGASVTGTLL
jgi:hypothetical protein